MKNPFLVGTKIYLRPLEREDAPLLVTWMNDHDVTRTMNWYRPVNLRAEEEFVDKALQSEHDLVLGIAVKENDLFIGETGLYRMDFKNRRACFGITIGQKTEWGKGYGGEATRLLVDHAFDTLNLNRVWLHVFEHNQRGIGAYQKAGFKKEGLLRQDRYKDGRYYNTIIMAVLREEWELNRQKMVPSGAG
jgi:ribosomal-protein-alanine N-acetyltransferase